MQSDNDLEQEQPFVNLRILGQLPRNGRLRLESNGHFTIEGGGIYIPFRRWLHGDSREQTLKDLKGVYKEAFKKMAVYIPGSNDYELLLKNLHDSLVGVKNLRETYGGDVWITSRFDILLDRVTNTIENIASVPVGVFDDMEDNDVET